MSRSKFRPSTLLVLAAILAWVLLLLYMQTALDSLKQNDNAGQEHLQSPAPPTVRLLSVAAAQKHNAEKDKSDDANVIVCTVTTDVRGNLGPAAVLLNNGTNWIQDRWQAASNSRGLVEAARLPLRPCHKMWPLFASSWIGKRPMPIVTICKFNCPTNRGTRLCNHRSISFHNILWNAMLYRQIRPRFVSRRMVNRRA
jgi:hypothetical protein